MQLLCPECCSEDVDTHPARAAAELRCANCGADFDLDEAHLTVAEARSRLSDPVPEELFVLDAARARAELGDPDGAIRVIDPFTEADALHQLIDAAQAKDIVRGPGGRVAISVYPLSAAEPDPLVAVDPGTGPTLLGFDLKLSGRDGEDPVAFTIRVLESTVEEANRLAAGRAADSERLDRVAAFLNANRPWNGGDVCQFLAAEIVASGRRLLEAGE